MKKETTKRVLVAVALLFVISFAITDRMEADSRAGAQNFSPNAGRQNPDAPAANNDGGQWAFLIRQANTAQQQPAPATPNPAATQEKTAGQVFKNIQMLKDVPASQILPIMHLFNASLGVRCEYCHVKDDKNEFVWDRDDKQHKKDARKMIEMTLNLNKTSFNNRLEVSCYTCHQGHAHPINTPTLPSAVVAVPSAQPQQPAAQMPTPDQILARYVEAVGGKEAIAKIKSRSMKGIYLRQQGGGPQVTLEVLQTPTKIFISANTPQGVNARGYNGNVAWTSTAQETRELDPADTLTVKDLVEAFDTLKLREPFPRLRLGGKDKVGDREVYVLRGALPDRRRLTLFFDVQSGLLLRKEILAATPVGYDPVQIDFEDYREVDGVKVPFIIRTSYAEFAFSGTRKFTEVKHNVAIDDAKFDMPKK